MTPSQSRPSPRLRNLPSLRPNDGSLGWPSSAARDPFDREGERWTDDPFARHADSSESSGETGEDDDVPAPPPKVKERSASSGAVLGVVDTEEQPDAQQLDSDEQEYRHARPRMPLLNRAFSMPLPSKLGRLVNPHPKVRSRTESDASGASVPEDAALLQKQLSQELADLVQLSIQTLLQLSPPHLLDPAKEQFAACGLTVPTTSFSALLSISKALNHLSTLGVGSETAAVVRQIAPQLPPAEPDASWDIAEMLQSTADVVAGQASERGVEIALFHADVALKHVAVKSIREGSDEGAVGFGLLHVIRRILANAENGSTLEIGLQISPQDSPSDSHPDSLELLTCAFEIVHHAPPSHAPSIDDPAPSPFPSNALTEHILCSLRADLRSSPLAPETMVMPPRRRYEFALTLARGEPILEPPTFTAEEQASRQPFDPDMSLAREPTLEELSAFAETLRGKKVEFHASLHSVFARHLTAYLATWGTDIQHVPTDDPEARKAVEEALNQAQAQAATRADSGYGGSTLGVPNLTVQGAESAIPPNEGAAPAPPGSPALSTPASLSRPSSAGEHLAPEGPPATPTLPTSFVIIDDDVPTLRRRLLQARTTSTPSSMSLSLTNRLGKRPTLAQFRTHSSPHIRTSASSSRSSGPSLPPPPQSVVFLHFTSLANYKHIKDVVATIRAVATWYGRPYMLPEVQVIPKPAGPRRFLTALYTAVNRPIVDPHFEPIATSPSSPTPPLFSGLYSGESRFPSPLASPSLSAGGRQDETPPASDAASAGSLHSRSPGGQPVYTPSVTSPLAQDAMSYFSDAATRMGGSEQGSRGILLQSPDGRPAGLFFHPSSSSVSRREGSSSKSGTPRAAQPPRRRSSNPPHEPAMFTPAAPLEGLLANAGSLRRRAGPGPPASLASFASSPAIPTLKRSPTATRPGNFVHSLSDSLTTDGGAGDERVGDTVPPLPSLPALTVDSRAGTIVARGESSPRVPRKLSDPSPPANRAACPTSPAVQTAAGAAPPPTLSHHSREHSGASTRSLPPDSPEIALPPQPTKTNAQTPAELMPPAVPPKAPTVSPRDGSKLKNQISAAKKSGGKPSGNGWLSAGVTPPISVLIVEDNLINQSILTMFMKRRKIKYGVAVNGEEAVEKWRSGSYHLILMDLALPVMSGIDATTKIRQLEKSNNIGVFPSTPPSELPPASPATASAALSGVPPSPFRSPVIIVALTASSAMSDRVAALAAGCNDFLTKPVNHHWLERKIIEWGCMQALIDFEGWRRSKGESRGNGNGQGSGGSSDALRGADLKAKSLAKRLRIDRTRSPSDPTAASLPNPTVTVDAAPPPAEPRQSPPSPQKSPLSAHSLSTETDVASPPIFDSSGRKESDDSAKTATLASVINDEPETLDVPDTSESSEISNPQYPSASSSSDYEGSMPPPPALAASMLHIPLFDPHAATPEGSSESDGSPVSPSAQGDVGISGENALQSHMEDAAQAERTEQADEVAGRPHVLGGDNHESAQSIEAVLLGSTPVGLDDAHGSEENTPPTPIQPLPDEDDSSEKPLPPLPPDVGNS